MNWEKQSECLLNLPLEVLNRSGEVTQQEIDSGFEDVHSREDPCSSRGECREVNETTSECFCYAGRSGPACDVLDEAKLEIYVISFLMMVGVGALSVWWVKHYNKQSTYNMEKERGHSYTPRFKWLSRKAILVYRVIALCWMLSVHFSSLAENKSRVYQFYTAWNFIIMCVIFGLGTALSSVAVFKPQLLNSIHTHRVENVHWVLSEVELATALLVDVLFWAVIFPPCEDTRGGCANFTSFSSVTQHAISFLFLFFDMIFTKTRMEKAHAGFSTCVALAYGVFHMLFTTINDDSWGHAPVYFFLDMGADLTPIWVIGVMLLHVVLFLLLRLFFVHVVEKCGNPDMTDDDSYDLTAVKVDGGNEENGESPGER